MSVIEYGAQARTTVSFYDDGYGYSEGTTFEVEGYATAEEAEASHGYFYGMVSGMSSIEVREDHVEIVRSRAEMEARTIPSLADVASFLASQALTVEDGIDIDEVDYTAKDGTFEVYGSTSDGLRFAARVQVLDVERTDF